tara:strand:- start:89 stop:1135 length:1047 start_codon:yes stop_codon:yes gene_type:complete
MSIFISDIVEGRIPYDDFVKIAKADVSIFTHEFRESVGVIHEDRKYIPYDEIYWGEIEENPVRQKGSSSSNIKALSSSRSRGIDPTAPLPAVSSCVIVVDDKTYFYKAENGITRYKADKLNNYTEGAVFDIVRFIDAGGHTAEYNRYVWLHQENDELPQGVNTVGDLVTTCSALIRSGDLQKEELAIREFVYESAVNMPTADKNEVVRRVLKEEDVPTKTISWRDNECREWLSDKCVDEIEVDYCFPYHYFQDRVYSLFKQYYESGDTLAEREVQNIVQHFENKGDCEEYILSQRTLQSEKWEELRKILWSIAEYMFMNDKQLPVNRVGFFPQIKTGENADDNNRIVK